MTTAASPIDEVVDLLKALRLPHMRRHAPDMLATAKAQRWEPAEAIRALLAEELAGRNASSINTRRAAAGFPTGKTFDTWDQTVSSIPEPTQRSLGHTRVDRPAREPRRLRTVRHRQESSSKHSDTLRSTTAPTSTGSPSRPSVVSFTDTGPMTR